MWMFESFLEFLFMLNYIPMKKNLRNVRNERLAHLVISLWLYLHGINFQRSIYIRGVILTPEKIYEK